MLPETCGRLNVSPHIMTLSPKCTNFVAVLITLEPESTSHRNFSLSLASSKPETKMTAILTAWVAVGWLDAEKFGQSCKLA